MKIVLVLFFFSMNLVLEGATFSVNNNNDAGSGSFRQAVYDANSNPGSDVINFTSTYSINLTSAYNPQYLFPPLSDVVINGNGSSVISNAAGAFSALGDNTLLDDLSFSQFTNGVLFCNPGATGVVTINNTTFTNNTNINTISQGGCILQFSGDLYMTNLSFINCSADLGGAICVRFGLNCFVDIIEVNACLANDFGNAIYMFNQSNLFLAGLCVFYSGQNIYRNPIEGGFPAGQVTLEPTFVTLPSTTLQID